MRDSKKNSPEIEQVKGNLSRTSYDLKQPLIQSGVMKVPGVDKVDLNDQQAERLHKSGHIA
jgi:hypothetical protein